MMKFRAAALIVILTAISPVWINQSLSYCLTRLALMPKSRPLIMSKGRQSSSRR